MSHESVQSIAKLKLEQIVANGMANAGPVIQRVLSEAPTDRIVRGAHMGFAVSLREQPRSLLGAQRRI